MDCFKKVKIDLSDYDSVANVITSYPVSLRTLKNVVKCEVNPAFYEAIEKGEKIDGISIIVKREKNVGNLSFTINRPFLRENYVMFEIDEKGRVKELEIEKLKGTKKKINEEEIKEKEIQRKDVSFPDIGR